MYVFTFLGMPKTSFMKADLILGIKQIPTYFKKLNIISSTLSDYNGTKLKIDNKKITKLHTFSICHLKHPQAKNISC